MLQRLSPTQRWAIVVALGALVLAAINLWWVFRFRDGYPLDIDEAGYTTFGLVDYIGLKGGGLDGWWNAIQAQPTFAPLVPALTSLLVYVKPGLMNGFVVLTVFLVVLTLAVYGISARLAGPKLGALAALIAATLPGTFAFAREYVFALPTAAFLACAIYAMLRSDGLRSRLWAVVCGAAIGLMLLSRTMAIAYVPGLLLATALAVAMRGGGDRARQIVNFVLLIATAAAVAATWYAKNLQSVVDYLTNYGYGSQSKLYGDEGSLFSWGRVQSIGERMITEDLFLPLAVLLIACLTATAVAFLRGLKPRESRRARLMQLARSEAASLVIVFVVGYGALMSSQNGGGGFTYPLTVLLPPLAVLALRRFPRALVPVVAAFGLVAAVNLLSTATIWSDASRTRVVSIPGFEETLPLTKGSPKAVFALRVQVPGPESRFDDHDAEWVEDTERLSKLIHGLREPTGEAPAIAFASRHRVLSSNAVQLASVAKYHQGLPLIQLAAEPNDSISSYAEQLTDPAFGRPTVLITTSRNTGDFPPVITQAYADTAARRAGFRIARSMALPDGRRLYVWQRSGERRAISDRSHEG